ncbi:MAG: ribonuclease E/G, partial [Clostridiales bacterium]
LKKDRIRVTIMGMTQLGLVELTRKKVGQELSAVVEQECSHCGGKGRVLLSEFQHKVIDKHPQM